MSKIGKRGGLKRAHHPAKHELAKRAAEVRWSNAEQMRASNHSLIQRDGEHYIFPWPSDILTPDKYALMDHSDKTRYAHKLIRRSMSQSGFKAPMDCEVCGKVKGYKTIVGHHDNYDEPMRIRFICFQCHTAIHHPSVAA